MNLSDNSLALLCALALVASFVAPVAEAQTTNYWRFEEGSANTVATGAGSILDSVGTDHGTPDRMPTYRSDIPVVIVPQTGATNTLSLEFGFSGTCPPFALCPNTVGYSSQFPFNVLANATIEFWMKVDNLVHGAVLWGLPPGGGGANRFHFFVNADNTVGFDYQSPASVLHTIFSSVPVPSGLMSWNHIAITKAGDIYSLYINGALVVSNADVSPDLPNGAGWSLSGRHDHLLQGKLDEVRVSNVALEPGEFLIDAGTTNVSIDIKPGSFPNSINLGSGGATPVAILGSATLDVYDINLDTLTLGTAGVKTVGKAERILCSVNDVSGDFSAGPEGAPDGFDDLVCHFVTESIVPEAGDTTATVMGDFLTGGSFEGTDSVNIVP